MDNIKIGNPVEINMYKCICGSTNNKLFDSITDSTSVSLRKIVYESVRDSVNNTIIIRSWR